MVKTEVVFQYFFMIGSGLTVGLLSVAIPTILLYKFLSKKIDRNGGYAE